MGFHGSFGYWGPMITLRAAELPSPDSCSNSLGHEKEL